MSEISFADIVLGVPTPEIEQYIEASFSLRDIAQFTHSSPTVDDKHWNRSGFNLDESIVINRMTWPVGAARWAMFHGVICETDIQRLQRKHGPQRFKFHGVTFKDMYALTPIPLQQTGQGVYIITVVDKRYWWWHRTGVVPAQASWASLFTAIGSVLGETITHSTVSGFLAPASDFFSHYHQIPLLLDAAAASIGRRVVVDFDGNVSLQTATEALTLANANRNYALRGGGQLASGDIALGLPASFRMVFPRSDAGVVSLTSHYASTYTPDVQLQRKTGTLRGSAVKTVSSTAIAYYVGTIQNGSELDALAAAWGEAWYRWQIDPFNMNIGEIFAWEPDAMHDLIFEARDGQAITGVRRLPMENIERTGHSGTYEDVSYAWDGDHVSRSMTNHGNFIAVPQNLTLSANATSLTLPDTETVRITATGSHFIHGIAGGIDGKRHRLWNVGANSWTLVNGSGTAAAVDRVVSSTGGNITLAANQSVEVDYQSDALWHASIAVASNTTVNLTSPGAIRWARLLNQNVTTTENLVQFYNATLMTLDESSMWVDGGSIWLANTYSMSQPVISVPYSVRSEDQTKAISGDSRALYSFNPATELALGICTAFDTSTGAISWTERVHMGGRTFSTGALGTFGSTQKAYEPNNQTVAVGDIGFLWRGTDTQQSRAEVAIQTPANGSNQSQIQSIIFTGQAANSYTLAFEGATSGNSTIAYGAPSGNVLGGLQFALNELLGNGTVTASGNGTVGDPYLVEWGDFADHSLIQAGVYDHPATAPLSLQWIWLPAYRTNYSGINVTLGNVTFNNTVLGGNVSIAPGNTSITVPFRPGDFVGWGEITASNQSSSGWVYSWQNAQPADINAFYHSGGGGTINNGTLWERNNMEIPVGEHVRVYLGDQTNGTLSVQNSTTVDVDYDVFAIASGGSFTLAVNNGTTTQTTGAISFGASAATVDSALEALTVVGATNAIVSGNGTQSDPYQITFTVPMNLTGNGSLLADNQNYVCEYEQLDVEVGTPNLSLQFSLFSGNSGLGILQGLANTTANLTYGVPAYSNFGPLRIIGTDSSNVSMAISLGSNLYLSGSNRSYTINSNVSTGNGTSAGTSGDVQFSDGAGGFVADPGGFLHYNNGTQQLSVKSLNVLDLSGTPKGIVRADNTGVQTVTPPIADPGDATDLTDIVAQFNTLLANLRANNYM